MNKMEIMRQGTLDELLRGMIRHKPGITSEKLWNTAKEWDHRLLAHEFDAGLARLHGDFRVTNKQWYERGHTAARPVKGPSKEDPRQVRLPL